jgi:hypothetical protein
MNYKASPKVILRCSVIALACTLTPRPMHAARPMITDDARIVDVKSCQVESWQRRNQGSLEYWALPGCNFTGNLEITFGGARTSDAAGTRATDVVLQGKTLFKTLETNGWGTGLAIGAVRHPNAPGRSIGEFYAYIPTSFSMRNDSLIIHTNVGLLHNNNTHGTRVTAGLGGEISLAENTWLIAESFKQKEGRPFFQAGVRHWILPNRVQIDATYGDRFGASEFGKNERWFSIGLRLLSPAFLP